MSQQSITPDLNLHLISQLRAIGLEMNQEQMDGAWGQVNADARTLEGHPLRATQVRSILKSAILDENENLYYFDRNDIDAWFDEVLQIASNVYVKEEYMGINLTRLIDGFEGTPLEPVFAGTLTEDNYDAARAPWLAFKARLIELIDSFRMNEGICGAYIEWSMYEPAEGLTREDDEAQRIDSDLEIEYRAAILDHVKAVLGITQELDDKFDTHTVVFDMACGYDEEMLLSQDDKEQLMLMAEHKFTTDDEMFFQVQYFQDHQLINQVDGDQVYFNDADLKGLVCQQIYHGELDRLDNQ